MEEEDITEPSIEALEDSNYEDEN
jgi:hypothetical protein